MVVLPLQRDGAGSKWLPAAPDPGKTKTEESKSLQQHHLAIILQLIIIQ